MNPTKSHSSTAGRTGALEAYVAQVQAAVIGSLESAEITRVEIDWTASAGRQTTSRLSAAYAVQTAAKRAGNPVRQQIESIRVLLPSFPCLGPLDSELGETPSTDGPNGGTTERNGSSEMTGTPTTLRHACSFLCEMVLQLQGQAATCAGRLALNTHTGDFTLEFFDQARTAA